MIEYTVRVFNNRTEWRLDGKLHSENDLPAREWSTNGDKEWWLNGKLHRENNLPAVILVNGYKAWFLNGKRHRTNGAAIEYVDGTKRWYIEGVKYSEEAYNKKMNLNQNSCDGKMVEVDGKKYKLILVED